MAKHTNVSTTPKRTPVLMQCGCVAQARDTKTGKPVCVVHFGLDAGADQPVSLVPDLTGREARCSYGHHPRGTVPSRLDLAFFEYRGPGSPAATEQCKKCGYLKMAHDEGRTQQGKCEFEPHGPYEFDKYYCGCWGWD